MARKKTETKTATLLELAKNVKDDAINATLAEIATQFTDRKAFEKASNPANDSVQDKLKAYERKMALPGIAALMIAASVSPDFVNRSISEGKRFNIYAIDKFNDLVHGLNSGHVKNAVNAAVIRSLFKCRDAGIAFTGAVATAAVSDKLKVSKELQQVLVRHTVSPATAPTQTSSTMNALSVLGVVKNTGSQKFPTWELQDVPATHRLKEVLAA